MRFISVIVIQFCLAFLVFPINTSAQSSFYIESQNFIANGTVDPWVNSYLTHNFNDKIGVFGWFLIQEQWAEAYGGVSFSPQPWIQFGIGGGLEQAENPWRLGSSLWLGQGRFSLLNIYEIGGGGYWYNSELNVEVTDWLGVGAMVQRFAGVGPRLEINIPKTPIKLWGAPLYNWEDDKVNGLFSIRFIF